MKVIIAGVDEVGRGSLIGPVYAAAVILKKKLDKKKSRNIRKIYKRKFLLVYWICIVKRDRKIKHFKCKFIGHEKSNKKINYKTFSYID